MKTVWVICQTIDLGYQMVKGYDSCEKAKVEFDRMYAEAVDEQVKQLMESRLKYTKEQADDWCASVSFYELDTVEIE